MLGKDGQLAELPEHMSKVLAELEARKASLTNSLESLDSAISGIRSLYENEPRAVVEKEAIPEQEILVRESASSVTVLPAESPSPESPTSQTEVSQTQSIVESNLPSEPQAPLFRPLSAPAPERRKASNLNVYVNQNTEWAAKQFIAPNSARAVFRHKTGHRCPTCGSQDTRISLTRGLADCFMFLFDYSIARCRNCDLRFRIWRSREDREEEEEPQSLEPQSSTE